MLVVGIIKVGLMIIGVTIEVIMRVKAFIEIEFDIGEEAVEQDKGGGMHHIASIVAATAATGARDVVMKERKAKIESVKYIPLEPIEVEEC